MAHHNVLRLLYSRVYGINGHCEYYYRNQSFHSLQLVLVTLAVQLRLDFPQLGPIGFKITRIVQANLIHGCEGSPVQGTVKAQQENILRPFCLVLKNERLQRCHFVISLFYFQNNAFLLRFAN